jgi:hypothetical protein
MMKLHHCLAGVLLFGSCVQLYSAVEDHGDDSRDVVHLVTEKDHARVPFLSWDTEGGDRSQLNLLRKSAAIELRLQTNGKWLPTADLKTTTRTLASGATEYDMELGPADELEWRIEPSGRDFAMTIRRNGKSQTPIGKIELRFPFDPRVSATTVLPAKWNDDGTLQLPAILSAPDFGQLKVTATPPANLKGRLVGGRASHTVDFSLEWARVQTGQTKMVLFQPVYLPQPAGVADRELWRAARRGWFNAFEPSSEWGDQKSRLSAPAGVLANNVTSDLVSCLMHLWADQIVLTPDFDSDIKLATTLRRTLDSWLDHGVKPTGEVYAYRDYAEMLDANASPLIAAWDYVEITHDRNWLVRRIERLELIADYLVKRDVDNDGLVESVHSGNYGTLVEPMRGGTAYDTINSGHKDAYCNVQTYRAWLCLADLEKQLGRSPQQNRYTGCARRLKASYAQTFVNPKTGWLVWWKSKDGQLHDLSSPMITSLAVCYRLVDAAQGRKMLDALWNKLEESGFKRFDLGVPITLAPVRRGDYLQNPAAIGLCGIPKREDGSDTFGQYLNGGCMVSDAVYFITALSIVGQDARGERILRAMIDRQSRAVFPNGGSFQNGVVDEYPHGAEFYTWDGTTCGYEGHLTYSFAFLQAILLRDAAYRAKLFRPLQ